MWYGINGAAGPRLDIPDARRDSVTSNKHFQIKVIKILCIKFTT